MRRVNSHHVAEPALTILLLRLGSNAVYRLKGGKAAPGLHGRRNRETIARRETRVATRLRILERAYLTALDRAL